MEKQTKEVIVVNLGLCQKGFESLKKEIERSIIILSKEIQFRGNINCREIKNTMKSARGEVSPSLEVGLLEFDKFAKVGEKTLFKNELFQVISHLRSTIGSYQNGVKVFTFLADNVDVLSNSTLCKGYVACVYCEKLLDKNLKFVATLDKQITAQQENGMEASGN